MTYLSIHYSQLPFLSPDLQRTLRMFDRYRDPFSGIIEHEIRQGDLEIMRTRHPELSNYRRRYPVDTQSQPQMISIDIGDMSPVGSVFASSTA
jgi:hypothetical protein